MGPGTLAGAAPRAPGAMAARSSSPCRCPRHPPRSSSTAMMRRKDPSQTAPLKAPTSKLSLLQHARQRADPRQDRHLRRQPRERRPQPQGRDSRLGLRASPQAGARQVGRADRSRSRHLRQPGPQACLLHRTLSPVARPHPLRRRGRSLPRHGRQVHTLSAGQRNYTTFSLWDTYRAAHPAYTLINPERVPDFANTLIRMAQQSPAGMPVWPLQGEETGTMTGYHSPPSSPKPSTRVSPASTPKPPTRS